MRIDGLSPAQTRVLLRVYRLMRDRAHAELAIKLHDGGVRDYREGVAIRVADLPDPANGDAALIEALNILGA